MKSIALLTFLAFATSASLAADKAIEQGRQDRTKDCTNKAGDKKGDERRAFMRNCLSSELAADEKTERRKAGEQEKAARMEKQHRFDACNKEMMAKKLKGDERKKFMSECTKG